MKNYTSYNETIKAIKSKETSCYNIVKNYQKTILEKNSEINAFVDVFSEESLQTAKKVDKKITEGKAGKLAGMVIGIKDNICIKNQNVSASSKILAGFRVISDKAISLSIPKLEKLPA